MSDTVEGLEGSALSAFMCRDFFDALIVQEFSRDEAVTIVAAWMSRPIGIDAAAYNAVFQNFASTMLGRDE